MRHRMQRGGSHASASALDTGDRLAVAGVSIFCGLAGLWALLSGSDVVHLVGGLTLGVWSLGGLMVAARGRVGREGA